MGGGRVEGIQVPIRAPSFTKSSLANRIAYGGGEGRGGILTLVKESRAMRAMASRPRYWYGHVCRRFAVMVMVG